MIKKKLVRFIITLTLQALLFLPCALSDVTPIKNTVRVIYFLPNDREPRPDIDTKLDKMIKKSQLFFADQMENHGFGRKTFQIETDDAENVVVHHVIGEFPDSHYHGGVLGKVRKELKEYLNSRNIYVVALDTSANTLCGVALNVAAYRGIALVPGSGFCLNVRTITHELGHNFGLHHDFRNSAFRMSYGGNSNQLSPCAAEFLDVHPYFNPPIDVGNRAAKIQIEALQEVFSDKLALRFQVSDGNGLHQAQLINPTGRVGTPDLLDCHSLSGKQSAVEFDTTSLKLKDIKNAVSLRVTDSDGYNKTMKIPIQKIFLPGPKLEGPWLWTIISTGDKGGEAASSSGIDYLSQFSDGKVTEQMIATTGAVEETSVGTVQWVQANISSDGGNNITQMINESDLNVSNTNNSVAYGSIALNSLIQQQTVMYAGSDDAVKIWINGTLVHHNPVNRSASDYKEAFPVTLQQGRNVLLVAVYNSRGKWSGFFGFKGSAKYSVIDSDGTLVSQPKIPGPKLSGPWLWMMVSTNDKGGAAAARSEVDYLAEESVGESSEIDVATYGVSSGDVIGNRKWIPAVLSLYSDNNINEVLNATGLADGDVNNHVAYGYIGLDSPQEQLTTMYVGSDDAVKVWINGMLVHEHHINRSSSGFQDTFPATLIQGKNNILVAVYERSGSWSGFFSFENQAVYTVLPHSNLDETFESTKLKYDVNGDGTVNIQDLVLVASNFGQAGQSIADVNEDGTVNIQDLVLVAGAFGTSVTAHH